MRWTTAVAAIGLLGTGALWLAGCGSDTSATAIVPGATPTRAAFMAAATPVPTATSIPDGS